MSYKLSFILDCFHMRTQAAQAQPKRVTQSAGPGNPPRWGPFYSCERVMKGGGLTGVHPFFCHFSDYGA